ncbi:hypothetical protein GCM10023405_17270 [Streptomonospora salina]
MIMRHNEILDVAPRQVAHLRAGGPGSLLLWSEDSDRVASLDPGHVPGDDAMIIAGTDDLDGIAAQAAENGDEFTDAYAARCLGEIGGDVLAEWPRVKALTPAVVDLRTDLARRGFYLAARPDHDRGARGCTITDTYRSAEREDLTIRVTSAFMNTDATEVRILATEHRREVHRFRLAAGEERPGMVPYLAAGAIGAAAAALPRI